MIHSLQRASRPLLAALAVASAALATTAAAATLTLTIEPVREARGTIQVAVYSSEQSFEQKKLFRGRRAPATAGTMKIEIGELPAGEYGVMVFQDLDGNDKLDRNLMGIPREPWGGSLGGKTSFGAPGWKDIRFTVPEAGASARIELSH